MKTVAGQELWVDTGQGRVYARVWAGAAALAPVVLFHDSLGCVELWRDFPERLAAATGRPVVAYDRLGFGRSDPHPGKLETSFVGDEAGGAFTALREQLGLERFVALGHSVGGGMAVGAAARFAQACVGLITEAAQTFVEGRTLEGIRQAQQEFARPGQAERLRKYHGDKAPWVLGAWIDTWLSPRFADWRLDEDLRRVRCPVLAVHGENDEYGSALHPRRIAELAGGPVTVELLRDCGHVPHREMAEAVLGLMGGWLRGVRG